MLALVVALFLLANVWLTVNWLEEKGAVDFAKHVRKEYLTETAITIIIVHPATVVQWHRQGFKLYWRWKSRKKPGRPTVDRKIRDLIRRMSCENPTWGAPRILSELLLLGYDVAESTVDKYMIRQSKPPSQTWRTFLANHAGQIAAVDFFTVPTVTFRVFYVFPILRHDRRRMVHFNVTTNPTARWAAQQIVEGFPYDQAPRFLLRDRDGVHGEYFRPRVEHMEIEEVFIAPRSPWQNPYVERLIGSIRRECLDHVIVLNEECRLNRKGPGVSSSWVADHLE